MKKELVELRDDIMPASFAYGFAGSILIGIALWSVALLLLI